MTYEELKRAISVNSNGPASYAILLLAIEEYIKGLDIQCNTEHSFVQLDQEWKQCTNCGLIEPIHNEIPRPELKFYKRITATY